MSLFSLNNCHSIVLCFLYFSWIIPFVISLTDIVIISDALLPSSDTLNSNTTKIIAVAVVCAIVAGALTFAVVASTNNSKNTDNGFDADAYYAKVKDCAAQIKKITNFEPDIAVVLGSGMGSLVDKMDVVAKIPYSSINGFPKSTAPGHEGNLVFGKLGDAQVVVMQGRVHYYEGYSMYDVVLPIRVIHELGVKDLVLTNAVGSLNYDYKPGTFVVVKDHISSLIPSPLIGKNIDELGPRFPPMFNVYNKDVIRAVKNVAASASTPDHKIVVNEGVLIQITGPQYETPAECAVYRQWGADTVGMSSVCESIVASHMGMRICNINCISDMADGTLSHKEVEEMVKHMNDDLTVLLIGTVKAINELNS